MSIKQRWEQRVRRGRGGVDLPHRRYTASMETVEMPVPATLCFPMNQHIGAPCVPTVAVGDTVEVGQVIGDSEQFVSAPIHSSVSGTVTDIGQMTLPGGGVSTTVVIASDGEQRVHESVKPPVVNSFEDFIRAVRQSGLVGLGGAGFPTHIKLNPKNRDEIDTIIINIAECEPYVTSDYRECLENSWDIVSGLQTVMEFLEAKRVLIAIERDRVPAIREMERIAEGVTTPGREVRVVKLRTRYPQGAEKVLIAACTGRKLAPGKLPADVGCVVLNAASVSFIARYLKTGMPLVNKRITVDGSAVAHPKNVMVPVGTPIADLIAFTGGTREEAVKLINGGPMMGGTLIDDDYPIMKASKAIVVLAASDCVMLEPGNCLRCGRCVKNCPMGLEPTALVQAYTKGDIAQLNKLNVMTCMDCGCCTFTCPAYRPLAETIRMAKAAARKPR
ncbi:MAG: electron transport complex subunit RsxC [Clostridia bacterium]|nr:electron transport complex subunit RsxC [Clostridia bacterium]